MLFSLFPFCRSATSIKNFASKFQQFSSLLYLNISKSSLKCKQTRDLSPHTPKTTFAVLGVRDALRANSFGLNNFIENQTVGSTIGAKSCVAAKLSVFGDRSTTWVIIPGNFWAFPGKHRVRQRRSSLGEALTPESFERRSRGWERQLFVGRLRLDFVGADVIMVNWSGRGFSLALYELSHGRKVR